MEHDDETRADGRRWPWWHRQTTTTRRVIRTSLALVVTFVAAAAFGVLTASADSSLGPHAAHWEITTQDEVALDLGPLGSVHLDSPLPWPLGVEVVVQEIPAELAAVPANPVTGLAGDLSAYAQVVSHPNAVVADAAHALVRDAVGRTVLAWTVLLVVIAGGRLASGGLLRKDLAIAARRPGVVPLAGVLVLTLAAVPTVRAITDRPAEGTTIRALAGTPMEDLRMTGRIAQLLDTYGGYLVDAYEENEAFYDTVTANLEAAYAADRAPVRPPGIPILDPAPAGAADGEPATDGEEPVDGPSAAEPQDGATAAPTATATDEATVVPMDESDARPSPTPDPTATPARVEPVTFLQVSDLHCNVGMASVIAAAVRLSGAQAVLDTGDTVMSGTSVESYCVNAFADAVLEEAPIVVSTGNHDSVTTAEQMRSAGYTVLGGDVVDVAGVSLLGDTDPTLTSIGEGTQPEREESVTEMADRLARTACDTGGVDLLLVHNPRAALPSLDDGCAQLALSGHWHRRQGPEVHGAGTRYVSASSAGASGGTTIGPLNGTAEMTVLRVDAASGRPLDYRVISIDTEGGVELGRWYRFPVAADAAATGGDTGARVSTEDPTGTERR
ncbi:metallophosphoesterase [Georgenia sp. 311]|uniref:metallophosphoesterase family protein n=1 Tax=Georgenia sp. 311 TaxID=2585134 RepID=UPI001112AF0C|nr:metallophosphoesterase [Georgenia sp. 311]TNC17036.1 metallophosphoesterase [Georgenia sp. 311]